MVTEPLIEAHPSGEYLVLTAAGDRELQLTFARLPGVRLVDSQAGRWMLPMIPRVAQQLRQLVGRVAATSEVLSWLERVPSCGAVADIVVSSGAPFLELAPEWGQVGDVSWLAGDAVASGAAVRVPLSVANIRALERELSSCELRVSERVRRVQAWLRAHPAVTFIPGAELAAYLSGGVSRLVVDVIWDRGVEEAFVAHEMRLVREEFKSLSRRHVPAGAWPPELLATLVHHLGLSYSGSAAELVERALQDAQTTASARERSAAVISDMVVPGLGAELMPYQRAGVEYVLQRRRVILSDEQGLGKTAQALAALQADNAFPAIVVCPPWLTLHWRGEVERWLPSRCVRIIDDTQPDGPDTDICIVSEAVLAHKLAQLGRLGARAVVFDEAQRLSHDRTASARAMFELVERLPQTAIRLALTGAPVARSIRDATPLMRLIGRLHEFPTTPPGPALEKMLRASCLIRRTRSSVLLQVPETRRVVIPIPTDRDAGITGAAADWIEDFLCSSEPLVVFCDQPEVLKYLAIRFPDALRLPQHLTAKQADTVSERLSADDAPQLCIAPSGATQPLLRLNNAAHVAFISADEHTTWHEQAEECVHQTGRERALTAWYLQTHSNATQS